MAINFPFDTRKAVEVICWLANEQPRIDLYTIVKAIYFADKEHLHRYGRPVIGDRYYAMEHGMVPSITYDILKGSGGKHGDDLRTVLDGVVERRMEEYPRFYPQRSPNEEFLSGTDVQCLRAGLEKCSGLNFDELKDLAHQDRAYRIAWDNKPPSIEAVPMDYESIIDDDVEERDELLDYLRETAPYLVM
ncbi:MAG: Panacea domain-containing protein [Gemmatimonadota bacterium]